MRPPHEVLSRGGSFGEPTDRTDLLFAWLVRNLGRLIEELDYHEVRAGRLAVWVAYRDDRADEGRASLEAPSDRYDVLLDAARPCLRLAWLPRALATRMHVLDEGLVPRAAGPMGCSKGRETGPRRSLD